jgi:hypothetical protein
MNTLELVSIYVSECTQKDSKNFSILATIALQAINIGYSMKNKGNHSASIELG